MINLIIIIAGSVVGFFIVHSSQFLPLSFLLSNHFTGRTLASTQFVSGRVSVLLRILTALYVFLNGSDIIFFFFFACGRLMIMPSICTRMAQ